MLDLRPIGDAQRPVVERLWQLYVHDLSEFRGTLPNDEGLFKAGRLPSYLDNADCRGFLLHGEAPMGFVFVSGLTGDCRMLAEFFVVRAARRQGLGHAAAVDVFRLFPGPWWVAFQEENPRAARFWRRVTAVTGGGTVREERRPVPNKPHIPPDTWIYFDNA